MSIVYSGSNRRNLVTNGDFSIAQRGTSQTSSGYGSDDRWINLNVGSTKTHTLEYFAEGQSDVPNYPTRYSRTVVNSVAGAANVVAKINKCCGVHIFSNKMVTFSFYGKADANKNISVEFGYSLGYGGLPSENIGGIEVNTFQLSTVWQRYISTFILDSLSGMTLGSGDVDHLWISFYFDAGSNWDGATNGLGQQSGIFDIADVQLEFGTQATPFDRRPIEEELLECLAFYEISRCASAGWSPAANATAEALEVKFKVKKHFAPSVSHINTSAYQLISLPGTFFDITVHGCKYAFSTTGAGNYSLIGDISASCDL